MGKSEPPDLLLSTLFFTAIKKFYLLTFGVAWRCKSAIHFSAFPQSTKAI